MVTAHEQLSKYRPRKGWLRILTFPIVRIFIALAFLVSAVLLHDIIMMIAGKIFEQSSNLWFRDVWSIVDIALFLLAYKLYARVMEKRHSTELSRSGAISETGIGIMIGAVLVCATVAIMYLADSYSVESFGSRASFIHLARRFFSHAIMEELVFRLILFRLLEEWLGSLWGFVIAGAICSLAHAGNPNSTVLTTISISSLSVLLTASFMLTRRIWLAWGVHVGWNYFQTAVFGMVNSGRSDHVTFITPRITGPEWLTGGDFGIEASWLAFAFVMTVSIIMIRMAVKREQVVRPLWLR